MRKLGFIIVVLMFTFALSACSNAEDKHEIANVENLISQINMEKIEKDAIELARNAYNSLDESLREHVSNYNILEDAETKYEEQLLRESAEQVENALREAHTTLYLNITGCMALREAVVTVWKNAIDNHQYADFNMALSALYNGEPYEAIAGLPRVIVAESTAANFVDALESVIDDHASLEEQIAELSSLEVDERVYEALTSLYAEYIILYNQVLSPSGSYVSYSAETNDSTSKVIQAQALLDAVWPY